MNNDNMKELRDKLSLNLKINNRKCEYCDWKPTCCEWCGKIKSSNNKRKLVEHKDCLQLKKKS